METCMICGRNLTYNEIGATRKFINRDSKRFYCKSCLAQTLGVPEAMLDERIEHFKQMGCSLFV